MLETLEVVWASPDVAPPTVLVTPDVTPLTVLETPEVAPLTVLETPDVTPLTVLETPDVTPLTVFDTPEVTRLTVLDTVEPACLPVPFTVLWTARPDEPVADVLELCDPPDDAVLEPEPAREEAVEDELRVLRTVGRDEWGCATEPLGTTRARDANRRAGARAPAKPADPVLAGARIGTARE